MTHKTSQKNYMISFAKILDKLITAAQINTRMQAQRILVLALLCFFIEFSTADLLEPLIDPPGWLKNGDVGVACYMEARSVPRPGDPVSLIHYRLSCSQIDDTIVYGASGETVPLCTSSSILASLPGTTKPFVTEMCFDHSSWNETSIETSTYPLTEACSIIQSLRSSDTPSEVYDSTTPPQCVDQYGATCGGLPGVLTVRRSTFEAAGFTAYRWTEVYYLTQYLCSYVRYTVKCVTPACAPLIVDCQTSEQFGPWGSCASTPVGCMKARSKTIVQNATGGGLPCSENQLYERTECTTVECQRAICNYTLVEQVGNCSAACGVGTYNISVYNISTTSDPICLIGLQSLVSVTNYSCDTNLPCSTQTPTEAILTCQSHGNTGYRGVKAASVIVDFHATLSGNHTNQTILDVIRVIDNTFGFEYSLSFWVSAYEWSVY
jgi:hypothetical protein